MTQSTKVGVFCGRKQMAWDRLEFRHIASMLQKWQWEAILVSMCLSYPKTWLCTRHCSLCWGQGGYKMKMLSSFPTNNLWAGLEENRQKETLSVYNSEYWDKGILRALWKPSWGLLAFCSSSGRAFSKSGQPEGWVKMGTVFWTKETKQKHRTWN